MSTYKSFADNINTTATATDTAAADDYYTCGLFGWRPRCLQRLATTRMFLLVFALLGVIQGANYTYMIASITTLEKRFQFGSKISGLILMTDNVMQLIANPLFGYLANRVHRPRMIALCQLIVVFGCYLAALPYFLYEYTPLNSYLIGGNFNTTSASGSGSGGHHQQLEYCDSVINNGNNTSAMGVMLNINDCGGDGVGADDISNDSAFYVSAAVLPAVIIFCLASCCNGIGFTAFYIIGIPFIDDNVNKKNSPIYISTTAALRLGGPTLGYFLSSFCLRFYENPFRDPGIDMRDPRWVGAWWLGFVILGTGVLLCLIPMLLFPRNFKSSPLMKRESYITLDNHTNDESDVWPTMQRLMSNPILICYTCGTTVNMFALFGYITFLGKYIESEYKRSASVANLFSGMIGVAPAALGIFFGGILIRQFKPGPKLLTTLIASVEIFGLIGLISAMFLGCPSGRLYGTLFDGQFDLQTQCNSQCRCTTKVYQPICGPDGRTNYFSPCYAGCSAPGSGQREDLSNCACFGSSLNRATLGSCRANRYCDDTFISFATMLSVGNFIGNLAKTGNSIIAFSR
ncbi:solute carrier organic anion transporter family member 74D-like [Oppia nitens]|uniref:solute carrier organic anion transporter family member 74D-like n=1 Tax=Oppia nitens TaxID=1686743 RepID=UPI0023DB2B33|nr:solute carrier organic anion transporter family member 74D-like [Oppia nitens]